MGIHTNQHIDVSRPHDNLVYFNTLIIKEGNAGTFSSAGLRDTMAKAKPPFQVPNILIILPGFREEDDLGLIGVHKAHEFLNCPRLPEPQAVLA